jgi:hypothetical protein
MREGIGSGGDTPPDVTGDHGREGADAREIVTRILRLPGYGVYAWEADEATNTLILALRQAACEPFYVCRGGGIGVLSLICRGDTQARQPLPSVTG